MSSNASTRPIQIHAIHPDNEKNFKALAAASKDIRSTRTNIQAVCTNCLRNNGDEPELDLLRCGRCKGVWYCSKDCQKKHCIRGAAAKWKARESAGLCKTYAPTGSLARISKRVSFFTSTSSGPRSSTNHLMARIDLGIEPADVPEFFNIFVNEPVDTANMKGMLRVNGFTPLTPQQMDDLTPMRMNIWRQARENADRLGFQGDYVGLMEFGNGTSQQKITCTIHIQQAAMDLVRESQPWVMTSAITGRVTEAPFNIETCMEFINTHFRADKKDQLLLRCPMRESDVQIIRDAAADSNTYPAQILKAKMAREDLFKPLMVGPDGRASRVPLA
ncbi:hypothetical protein B0H19DRAFT_1057128 [Mycena capillaripes]|nr:hypothetical protein B0H19DRAFT_1057128 [Mycena capillaripes]